MSIGLTRSDVYHMTWGELVLTLQAHNKTQERYASKDEKPHRRKATDAEVMAWAGAGSKGADEQGG